MTYEEWIKTPEYSAKLREFISNPIWKAAMQAIEDLSPARVSSLMPNLAVGAGDYLIGRVQGWEIFKESIKILSEERIEPKQPQILHGVNPKDFEPRKRK